MTKLSYTSQTTIAITFLVMNLSTYLLRLFSAFLCLFLKIKPSSQSLIIQNYDFVNLRQQKLIFNDCWNNYSRPAQRIPI